MNWYALTVKPQHEKAVARALDHKALEGFLPLCQARRRWSDRVKLLELPLFPGYVFCRFSSQQRLPVLTTPGVNSIVGFGKAPTPVSDAEIHAVRAMVESGLPVGPHPYLKEGQAVIIRGGPLRGLEGKLARVKEAWRVVVNVELLQRSVAVTIDRDLISVTSGWRPTSLDAGRRPRKPLGLMGAC